MTRQWRAGDAALVRLRAYGGNPESDEPALILRVLPPDRAYVELATKVGRRYVRVKQLIPVPNVYEDEDAAPAAPSAPPAPLPPAPAPLPLPPAPLPPAPAPLPSADVHALRAHYEAMVRFASDCELEAEQWIDMADEARADLEVIARQIAALQS